MALSKSEENRRYRAKRKAAGRGRTNKLPSAFERGRFVAIDGEGFADGAPVSVDIEGKVYASTDHRYALLMDSDGHEAWAPEGRLHGKQCLDFLLDIAQRDKHGIIVCFGGSYDACHMLAFILDRDEIKELLTKSKKPGPSPRLDITLTHDGVTHDYRIVYMPRKELRIWRFSPGADKYREHTRRDGGTEWKLDPEAKCVLWDTWGFFQGTFMKALDNWLPDDPDYQFIKSWKDKRSGFSRSEIATIRKYTAAELRCLVSMMERLRDSVRLLGLTITRWDGAGAIAGAMFKKHEVKDHMAETPAHVFQAARIAYSGGHIEACKVGFHNEKVWHYDINSAYPDQFRRLPGLSMGQWTTGHDAKPPGGFTLIQLEFHFRAGLPFYPLFYRTERGEILYPERGSGWYWFDEFDTARDFAERFGAYEFRVVTWHHFRSTGNSRPFEWVEDYYAQRQAIIEETRRTGIPNGAEHTYKLGCNSAYGKTAQQVGARFNEGEIQSPSFFQIEWAGYVTSGCRAKLMRAAMQSPENIISFATDALFSTAPLDLHCPDKKELGAWERKVHEGMTIVMPGVYWLHDADAIKHFSRGFNKEDMTNPAFVHEAWRKGETTIKVRTERMITLGAAMMSENFWTLRGLFVKSDRELKLCGQNVKRFGVKGLKTKKLHTRLIETWPRGLMEDVGQSLGSLMSAPYPISWLDYEEPPEETDAAAAAFFVNDGDAGTASFFV